MSKAMQLVGIILLSIFTLVIIYLMSDVRSTNELDYYLLQEVTEASMYDAVDYSYYRETGLLRVDRNMFLENFNRRFAESVDNDREYEIKIIDFNETPPKVSVEVTAPTVASVKGEVALVTNRVSGIIETIYDDYVYSRGNYGLDNYDDEKPEITVSDPVNNNYKITMTDNYMLEKYAIVELGNTGINQFTDSTFNQITNWINIKGYVKSYLINQTIAAGKNGFWVVAVDRGGLWTAVPITDSNPYIASWAFSVSKEGKISATFKDDRGLASYTVTPVKCNGSVNIANNGKASCNGTWVNSGTPNTVAISDATIGNDNYYTKTINNIDISKAGFYAITVKDSKGNNSEQLVVQGNRKHEIKVDYTTQDEVNFRITISDSYGDLTYYQVSNKKEPSSKEWKTVGTYNSTISFNWNRSNSKINHYIHAKDSAGKVVTKIIPAKVDCVAQDTSMVEFGPSIDNAGNHIHQIKEIEVLSNIDMSKYKSVTFDYYASGCQNWLGYTAYITVTCGGNSQNILTFTRSRSEQSTKKERTTELTSTATISFGSTSGMGKCTVKVTGEGHLCGSYVRFDSAKLNCR